MQNFVKGITDFVGKGVGELSRFAPEPYSSAGKAFSGVVDSLFGDGIKIEYGPNQDAIDLIGTQIAAQQQMQETSMKSNIARTKHEMKMTPIRNMRLSA